MCIYTLMVSECSGGRVDDNVLRNEVLICFFDVKCVSPRMIIRALFALQADYIKGPTIPSWTFQLICHHGGRSNDEDALIYCRRVGEG